MLLDHYAHVLRVFRKMPPIKNYSQVHEHVVINNDIQVYKLPYLMLHKTVDRFHLYFLVIKIL